MFKATLGPQPDVLEAWASGSLRRSTYTGPKIHDLDLVVVFDQAAHPGWGEPGESAANVLDHLAGMVKRLLGVTNGTHRKLVRIASPRDAMAGVQRIPRGR